MRHKWKRGRLRAARTNKQLITVLKLTQAVVVIYGKSRGDFKIILRPLKISKYERFIEDQLMIWTFYRWKQETRFIGINLRQ